VSELIERCVYEITSRNLRVGVYIGSEGDRDMFIGIREKFGYRYLTTECGWNAKPIGRVPDHAALSESDSTLRRQLAQFDTNARLGRL